MKWLVRTIFAFTAIFILLFQLFNGAVGFIPLINATIAFLLMCLLFSIFRAFWLNIVKKKDIISIDIETTGTNMDDEILQIAIIDGNYKTLLNTYVKPQMKSWESAMKVNHIKPSMVKNAPTFSQIKKQVKTIICSHKVIVGYNLKKFDIPLINRYYAYGIDLYFNTLKDVMRVFSDYVIKEWNEYYGNYEWQSLDDCCEYYHIENVNPHDALSDAKATLKCFYKMCKDETIGWFWILD